MVKRKVLLCVFCVIASLQSLAQNSNTIDVSSMISPTAVRLDIDRFLFFSHGVLGVLKGDKQAIIDVEGNFIVPWGKYQYNVSNEVMWGKLINAYDPVARQGGYIDLEGKIVTPLWNLNYTFINLFNHFGLSRLYGGLQKDRNIDVKGNVLPVTSPHFGYDSPPVYLREVYTKQQNINRILITKEVEAVQVLAPKELPRGKSGRMETTKDGKTKFIYKRIKYGYGNKYGKILLDVDYEIAREFTNGMAAVMKTDEFGVQKWGYIDTIGRLIIPFTFKNEPGYFHDGLALVEPTDKTEFQFAYIDKSGQIKIKIGDSEKKYHFQPLSGDGLTKKRFVDAYTWAPSLTESGYFINGYSFWNKSMTPMLLDTTGKFFPLYEFVNRPDLSGGVGSQKYLRLKFDELGIYYSTDNSTGVMDYHGNALFPFFPGSIRADYFSPYALVEIGNDIQKKPQYGYKLEGVINKEGQLILIKEKKEIF